MKKSKHIKSIVICSLLSSIAVVLQTAPIYLPGLGIFLSPLSTLPIAIAAIISIPLGIYVYIASILLLLILNLQESIIFLFTTGLIGLLIGLIIFRKGLFISICASSISLILGMIVLTYIISIPGFSLLFQETKFYIVIIIYVFFSIIYNSIWNVIILKYRKHIELLV